MLVRRAQARGQATLHDPEVALGLSECVQGVLRDPRERRFGLQVNRLNEADRGVRVVLRDPRDSEAVGAGLHKVAVLALLEGDSERGVALPGEAAHRPDRGERAASKKFGFKAFSRFTRSSA